MAAEESAAVEESSEAEARPSGPVLARPPYEIALVIASLIAAACSAGAIFGALKGWTSPTLGVVFFAGAIESLVAVGLSIKVLLLEEKRVGLFVPGAVLAAAATASLTGIFLLSGSI